MLAMRPLSSTFVVEITGMDLSMPLSPPSLTVLVGALYRHRAVVLPRQSLSIEQFARFGGYFGEPKHNGAQPSFAAHPGVMPLAHRRVGDDRAPRWQAPATPDDPATAIVLYAEQPPDPEAGLLIADLVAAYETLSEERQALLDTLSFRHADGRIEPLVRRHRLTGRRALAPVAAEGAILGLPADRAAALLEDLRAHCLRPAFIYRHQCLLGDVVAWDPAATMYAATWTAEDGAAEATLYRLDLQGIPAVLPDGGPAAPA